MKLNKLLTSICLGTLLVTSPAHAKDPCKTVLCMWGKFKGAGAVNNCESAVSDYFDILIMDDGVIQWGATANARQNFLDSCPAADGDKPKQINNEFGKLRG